MLLIPQILVRTFVLGASAAALAACGQQGPLYLPPAGTDRATLPESLLPAIGKPQNQNSAAGKPTLQPAPQPASATSAP